MNCINVTAVIKNTITTSVVVGGALVSVASILTPQISASVVIPTTSKLTSEAVIASKLTSAAQIINSGINYEPCPLILNIDGGNAFTLSYPGINGLLNGGSA